MKKIAIILLSVVVLSLSLSLVGCNNSKPAETNDSGPKIPEH